MNITFFNTRYYNSQIKIINKKKNFCTYINKCNQYCDSSNPIYCFNCLYLIESEPNLNYHFSDYILVNNYNNDFYYVLRNSINNNINNFNNYYNNFHNEYYYNENNYFENYNENNFTSNYNFDEETISIKSGLVSEQDNENYNENNLTNNYNFDEETISIKSGLVSEKDNEYEKQEIINDKETISIKSELVSEKDNEYENQELINDEDTISIKSDLISEKDNEKQKIIKEEIVKEEIKKEEIKKEEIKDNLSDRETLFEIKKVNKLSKQEKNKLKKKRKIEKKKLEKMKENEEKKLLDEMQNLNKINLLEKFKKIIVDEKELKIINMLSYKELSERIKKPIIYDIKNKLLELYNKKNKDVILNMQIYDDFKDFELSEKQSVDKIVSYLKKSNFNRFYFNSIYELIYFNKLIIFIKDKNGNVLDTEISKNNDEVTFYEEILEKEINEYFRDYMIKVLIIPFIQKKKEELKNKYQEYEDKLFKKKKLSFEENLLINYRGMIKIEGNMYFGKKGIFKFDKYNNVSKFYYN